MLTPRVVRTIFVKELRETLRDRRAVLLLVLVPILLYPALLLIITQVAAMQSEALDETVSRVGVAPGALPEPLVERLAGAHRILLVVIEEEPETPPQAMILAGELDAVVLAHPGFHEALTNGGTGRLRLLFDGAGGRSMLARERVEDALTAHNNALLTARLAAADIAPEFIAPLVTAPENIAPPERMGGHILGQILPLLLVLAVVMGAFHPAVDLTAGEKERGTLQTLLTAPISPLDIVAGKFLAVLAIAFVAGLVNVGSMALVFTYVASLAGEVLAGAALDFRLPIVLLLFLVVVALGLFLSAVMMTVAVLARSFKEAQSYLTPVYLLALVPVMLTQLPGSELSTTSALVPALNLALLVKELLRGPVSADSIFLVLASTGVYTALTLAAAARLFEREAVLLGTAAPLRAAFGRAEGAGALHRGRDVPDVAEALVLFGVLFVLLFYVGSLLQRWHLIGGLLLTLWGLIAAVTILFARLRNLRFQTTFLLAVPRPRALAGASLVGLGAWLPVLALVHPLQSEVLPVPRELAEGMATLLQAPEGVLGVLLLYFAVAISPAVCEELVFRGLLFSAFRRAFSPAVTVVLSAALFAVFHLSIFRLFGTFALGLVAGGIALLAGSVWPAMVFHAVNNAVLVALAGLTPTPGTPAPGLLSLLVDGGGAPTAPAVALGAVLAVGGFLLLRR